MAFATSICTNNNKILYTINDGILSVYWNYNLFHMCKILLISHF